ncbi:hypothetical protein HEP81_02051 [Streptomyces griseofuscus]|uniref:Core-binding (CB) domain-containing protein n=2 Tax=Streptomyces griseofuscus TaxID=146922 RepID=A0A7H1PWE7_9ACTN|nr:hypothetical protein [Streptomyces griseofuscus]QNT92377.1 hypothetical protein HEP81_02051 [Streptomyces griseofuscus]
MPYDRWHKSRPKDGESTCKEHGKVPTRDHGTGKRWQARWRNREDVQQTELFRTEVEARRHETKMRSGVDDGSYINPRAGEVRVSELALTWLKGHEHKNPRTYRRHKERILLHVVTTAVGKMRVKDVNASSLLDWLHDRRRLLESSTLRLVFDNLRAVFDLAVDDSLIPKNPCLAKSVQDAKPKR